MSDLFNKSRSTINEHILNIFKENELSEEDNVRKIGNSDFSTKPTNFYNLPPVEKDYLDTILALEQKVTKNSNKA